MTELLLSAFLFCTAQPGPPSAPVDRYVEAYNARDIDGMRSVFTDDARILVWTEESAEPERYNVDTVVGAMRGVFSQFPDITLTTEGGVELGARVAQIERYVEGPPASPAALVVYTVTDGCIVARESYW